MQREHHCDSKKVYTEEIHVHRLVAMLNEQGCNACPAAPKFTAYISPYNSWKDTEPSSSEVNESHPCVVCRKFVGLPADNGGCPCSVFGRTSALRRTRARIRNYFKRSK